MLAWPGDTQQNAHPNRSPTKSKPNHQVPKNQATGKIAAYPTLDARKSALRPQ